MSLRELLKSETAALHDEIEKSSLMRGLMAEEFTRQDYVVYLRRMRDFYAGIEARLSAVPRIDEDVPDFDRRMKVNALNADLFAMGDQAGAGDWKDPFEISDLSQALGVMYVLEGSTLGGQLISRKLRERDFISEKNLNFFNHYGADVGVYWKKFVAILENPPRAVEKQRAVEAALRTFRSLMAQSGASAV